MKHFWDWNCSLCSTFNVEVNAILTNRWQNKALKGPRFTLCFSYLWIQNHSDHTRGQRFWRFQENDVSCSDRTLWSDTCSARARRCLSRHSEVHTRHECSLAAGARMRTSGNGFVIIPSPTKKINFHSNVLIKASEIEIVKENAESVLFIQTF